MVKRLGWLLASVLLPLLLLGGFGQVEGMRGETAVTAAPLDVIISEVGWGGTAASSADEWIELYNNTENAINLSGWTLSIVTSSVTINLQGTILAKSFYLLERTDDNTISNISADKIYTGSLLNNGDRLHLRDNSNQLIDSANVDGGSWPAGSASPAFYSMERVAPLAPDVDLNWENNDGVTRNGLDADGNLINGTAKSNNSGWTTIAAADLTVTKTAPAQAEPDSTLVYTITLQNMGNLTATAVILTDTLPASVTYVADNSGYLLTQPDSHTLVWQVGQLITGSLHTFNLTTTLMATATGTLTNHITTTTPITETNHNNNHATATTTLNNGSETAVLIDAFLPDGWTGANHADEAISLRNIGTVAVNLAGWQLNGKNLPPTLTLLPQQIIWLTKDANAFTAQFGFAPDGVMAAWPILANDGGNVSLANNLAQVVDVVVYGNGNTNIGGWAGTAVQRLSGYGTKGYIYYRQRDQRSGQAVPDTNTVADWAQFRADIINGRKVRYPGWDLDEFFFTTQVTETAVLTIAIAPDNAYEAIVQQINSAQTSLQVEALSFENTAIATAFIQAATRGVSVTLLLEGGPVGGVTDQEHYLCQELMVAGGLCAFMINDSVSHIYDRYDYLHAKFVLIDGERVIISSQNFSPSSLPNDDKSDGTWGRRGVVLITDAPHVVAHLQTIFARDYDTTHADILNGIDHLSPLPLGFAPITQTGGTTYTVRYPQPVTFSGVFPFEIVQSPENSLRNVDGLLGLVNRAGAGDVVLVQQLYERPFWGNDAIVDPNPRLEAYLNAARRGAQVRILLDAYFDVATNKNSNAATCASVNEIAKQEHLRLECALANPTGLGIHNKMVLVQIDGKGYLHVGSINGSEASSKVNREVALQVQSNEAYTYLAALFDHDWPYRAYLPVVLNNFHGSANHILISEVQYNPRGANDEGEYVELVNPTSLPVDISAYSLGDAVNREDFEDVRRFPAGTILLPQQTLVIATSATAFFAEFNRYPDFEILETETAVPNLIDDPTWGNTGTFFQLGNLGDEILLRGTDDHVIDIVVYGNGSYPGTTACPLVTTWGAVLERYPYWQDTNQCPADFREWPYPNPGTLSP